MCFRLRLLIDASNADCMGQVIDYTVILLKISYF
jgi:hypothetical protein